MFLPYTVITKLIFYLNALQYGTYIVMDTAKSMKQLNVHLCGHKRSKKPIKAADETLLLLKSLSTAGCQKIREK